MKLADSVAMMGGMRSSPDQQIIGGADGQAAGQRRQQGPAAMPRVAAIHHRHRHRAGQPDIGGQRQIDIAGPSVMTNIWPTPTSTVNMASASAAVSMPPAPCRQGGGDGDQPDRQPRPAKDQDPGLGKNRGAWHHHAALRRPISARAASTRIRIAPFARDLPVGRDVHEGQERRRGQRQGQCADHRADRRNAAADEFAAAQNDARDGKQRIAIADIGVGGGGDADQRQA